MRTFSKLGIVILLAGAAFGQTPWSSIIHSNRAISWNNAGVVGGIPDAGWGQFTSSSVQRMLGFAWQESDLRIERET